MFLLSGNALEHFRCSKCCSPLSRGPIYSGPIKAPVCGRCVPDPKDVPNPPLEAFLRKCKFPCKYQENSCMEIVSFDDMEHEEQCQFKDPIESPFEIIDRSMLRDWKCCSCDGFLTVGPLSLNEEGKSICGRCIDQWSEEHKKETLVRNSKLEFIMKRLSLPCNYYDLGCERALKWGEIKQHEESCPRRPFSCPVTPFEICKSVVPAGQLYTHFEQEHAEYLLANPKFRENLSRDSETNRLVRVADRVFLLVSRISVNENRMWFSAALVSDPNISPIIQYIFKVSNLQETLHMPFVSETLKTDIVLSRNQEKAIQFIIEGTKDYFQQPDLQEVVCSFTVKEECAIVEQNLENLRNCKWTDCEAIGTEAAIKRHETELCAKQFAICKWNCGANISSKNLEKHENVCEKRLFLCKFDSCNGEYLRSEIEVHESQCDFRVIDCQWMNCDQLFPFHEKEEHESQRCEGFRYCRYPNCNMKCLVREWNLHIQDCNHLLTKKYYCEVCLSGNYSFPPPILAQHLLHKHPKNICEGANWNQTTTKGNEDRIYLQFDGSLFQGYYRYDSDGRVVYGLWLIGEDDVCAEYKYKFKLIHPTDPQQTITMEHGTENKWYITSSDVVDLFVKDDSITFAWKIFKL